MFYLLVRDVEYRGGLRMFLNLGDEPVSGTAFPNALGIDEMRRIDVTPIEHNVMGNPLEETNSHQLSLPHPILRWQYHAAIKLDSLTTLSRDAWLPCSRRRIRYGLKRELSVLPVPGVFCGRLSSGNSEDTVDVFWRKAPALWSACWDLAVHGWGAFGYFKTIGEWLSIIGVLIRTGD